MKKQLKWIVLGVMCIVIGSGLGVFYQLDQKKVQTLQETHKAEAFDLTSTEIVDDTMNDRPSDVFENSESMVQEEHFAVFGDEVYVYTDDIQTFLIMGTDQSGNQVTGSSEYHGAMADMLMLLVIDHTTKDYTVLQLNRDTIANVHLIDVNGDGEACADIQICTAHWYGGNEEMNCENTVRAVSELIGYIPIDTYYCLDWEGIETLNEVVDGVTLTIQNDFSNLDSSLVYGENITLTNTQAVTFLRGRHGVDDGENVSRMSRHQQYLSAWVEKVKEKSASDQSFPARVYQELSPYATTNFKGKDIGKQFNQIFTYENRGIVNFEGEFEIGQALGDGIEHMEFYVDEESKVDTLSQLYHMTLTDLDAEDFEED